eukprot:g19073.t1
MEKEPLFTKIVELEAILSCYQNEFIRLGKMGGNVANGNANGGGGGAGDSTTGTGGGAGAGNHSSPSASSAAIANEELAVLQNMLSAKNMEVDALVRKKAKHVADLGEAEADFQLFLDEYKRVETALNDKHAEVKLVYERFKTLLEDVKRKEQARKDLEKLEEANQEYESQIKKLDANLAALAGVANRVSGT